MATDKIVRKNIAAKIKTKAGISRGIQREMGGKQEGKIMVPFSQK